MYAYFCDLGSVECRSEPNSEGRFSAVVVLVHAVEGGHDVLRHICRGSDDLPSDAAARARAWAETNYPPIPTGDSREEGSIRTQRL